MLSVKAAKSKSALQRRVLNLICFIVVSFLVNACWLLFYDSAKVMLKTETAIGITLNSGRETRLLRRLLRRIVVILLMYGEL